MKKFIITTAIALFIQGCATPYQSSGFTGGYKEVQLDENVFQVSFRGNGYTSRTRATNFTLLRSAELTLENGFKYFVIIDEKNATRTSGWDTTSDGLGGFTTTVISKPGVTNTIVLYKEEPVVLYKEEPDSIFSYNAEFLYKSMRTEYDID